MRDGGERRGVRGLPGDPEGAAALRVWVARPGSPLDVAGLDLSSADLSGADFGTGMLAGAVLRDAVLIGTDFYRCHMEGVVLEGADLTGACLVKAVLDGASLRRAVLDGVDLGSSELYDVDLRDASLRGARLDGASLGGARMQGADLSRASMRETAFAVLVDEHTVVRGLAGSAYGPMTVDSGGRLREVGGRAMEVWLSGRGADVRVIDPAFPDVTYYAKIDERHPRPAPRGVVRRRVLDGVSYDEAFTRNLRWEPTEYLRLHLLGHNEVDHVEITESEADAFIATVVARLGERS
ncbi:pentapeptide repeat-containing protein [Streptomyces sp. NPDC006530]|uniref:pentapeptide repeat-containing protein n=1 Tax=Streptomyces sp. NPDC006530 TaxID=3364750 RepID=UPI0036977953